MADHLSWCYPLMEAGVAGHVAFASEGSFIDIEHSGRDFMDLQR